MNGLSRKILIFGLVMAVVAAGGWFGRKAYKRATERRMLVKARSYIDKKDWANAGMCLQRALQLNPFSAAASDAMADLLETGGVPAALNWRMRAAQLAPAKSDYRLAWAKTAILLADFQSAHAALDGLTAKDKASAEYHKLAGALAWGLKDRPEAERQYEEALRLEPTSQKTVMNLATIHLSSSNAAVVAAARVSLAQMITNTDLRIPALRLLRTEAISRKSTSDALPFARQLALGPEATVGDRIDYVELLRESKSPDYSTYLQGFQNAASTNAIEAFALGRWMADTDDSTNALRWLRSLPSFIQTNQPVTVLIADCFIAQSDWKSLLAWVGSQDWEAGNYARLAIESLAQSSLGQETAAKGSWQKALKSSRGHLDRLSHLAQLSSSWGRDEQRLELLREITSEFPKEKWASELLVSKYYADGNSKALADLVTKSYAADPADPKLKNNLATISLLRKSDLDQAYRLAREAYDSSPDNPFFASTYAYSLLMQEKPEQAIKVMSGVKTNFLQIPTIAAYYGIVQARAGHKELAREPLEIAGKARLLPEEKAMVRSAQRQL